MGISGATRNIWVLTGISPSMFVLHPHPMQPTLWKDCGWINRFISSAKMGTPRPLPVSIPYLGASAEVSPINPKELP